jgi:hypothetical protein
MYNEMVYGIQQAGLQEGNVIFHQLKKSFLECYQLLLGNIRLQSLIGNLVNSDVGAHDKTVALEDSNAQAITLTRATLRRAFDDLQTVQMDALQQLGSRIRGSLALASDKSNLERQLQVEERGDRSRKCPADLPSQVSRDGVREG